VDHRIDPTRPGEHGPDVARLERSYRAAVNSALIARADYLTLLESPDADGRELRGARRLWERLEAHRQDIAAVLDTFATRDSVSTPTPPVPASRQEVGTATSSRR
jgi:hypothetical protein